MSANLQQTLPVMANPGMNMEQSLYYTPFSATQVLDEIEYSYGVSNESKSINLGGTVSFNLSDNNFMGDLWLQLSFGEIPANCFCGEGWAYRMIDNIQVQVGAASNTYTYDSHTLLVMSVAECENREKVNEMIRLAGGAVSEVQAGGAINNAYILIHTPWSSLNGSIYQKKAFECVNNRITMRIKLRGSQYVFDGSAVFNPQVTLHYFTKSVRYIDGKKSMSGEVAAGLAPYVYPYYHPVSHIKSFAVSSATADTVLPFDSIMPGQIESMLFFIVRNTHLENGAGDTLAPFLTEPLFNIRMKIGGTTKLDFQNEMGLITDVTECYHSNKFSSDQLTVVQTVSPFLHAKHDSKIYRVSFTMNPIFLSPDDSENCMQYRQSLPVEFRFVIHNIANYTLFLSVFYKSIFIQTGTQTNINY